MAVVEAQAGKPRLLGLRGNGHFELDTERFGTEILLELASLARAGATEPVPLSAVAASHPGLSVSLLEAMAQDHRFRRAFSNAGRRGSKLCDIAVLERCIVRVNKLDSWPLGKLLTAKQVAALCGIGAAAVRRRLQLSPWSAAKIQLVGVAWRVDIGRFWRASGGWVERCDESTPSASGAIPVATSPEYLAAVSQAIEVLQAIPGVASHA